MSKTIEVLLVVRDDHGGQIDPPRLLVNDRLWVGKSVPNGLLFNVEVPDDPEE